jgi:hypothetical protein
VSLFDWCSCVIEWCVCSSPDRRDAVARLRSRYQNATEESVLKVSTDVARSTATIHRLSCVAAPDRSDVLSLSDMTILRSVATSGSCGAPPSPYLAFHIRRTTLPNDRSVARSWSDVRVRMWFCSTYTTPRRRREIWEPLRRLCCSEHRLHYSFRQAALLNFVIRRLQRCWV